MNSPQIAAELYWKHKYDQLMSSYITVENRLYEVEKKVFVLETSLQLKQEVINNGDFAS